MYKFNSKKDDYLDACLFISFMFFLLSLLFSSYMSFCIASKVFDLEKEINQEIYPECGQVIEVKI